MKVIKFLSLAVWVLFALPSCGGSSSNLAEGASGDLSDYESESVNAIEQARPTIMVIPSDNLLKKYDALTTKDVNDKSIACRDYAKYLLNNADGKRILSFIQDSFVQDSYPLQDLEQTLKSLANQDALDSADDIEKDAKTILMTTAQPDIIIELDYKTNTNLRGSLDKAKKITFTLNVIDAYTNNIISSKTFEENGNSAPEVFKEGSKSFLSELKQDVQKSFSDVLKRGRNITVRVAIANGSNVSLSDESIEGDTYSDWIIDYIKTHTVKGAYKLQHNTNKELYFVNCRIKLLNEDGTQYGVYDWTRDFCKAMRKDLGVSASNKSQGLGEVMVTINGMK